MKKIFTLSFLLLMAPSLQQASASDHTKTSRPTPCVNASEKASAGSCKLACGCPVGTCRCPKSSGPASPASAAPAPAGGKHPAPISSPGEKESSHSKNQKSEKIPECTIS